MARELRERKSKATETKPVETKAPKPASSKRKAAEDASPVQKKKQKPAKPDAATESKPAAKKAAANGVSKAARAKEAKAAKKTSSKKAKPEAAEEKQEEEASDDEVGDETQALVQILDDGADEADEVPGGEVFKPGQDVGKIPKPKGADKVKKQITASGKEDTGIIYIGRLPHGFYEHEMRGYFSQFGEILNLRLSRNKKTGASKHYAFVEFLERSTAEIVAKTMDHYLLFGHILRVRVVNDVPPNLFKGANRRFKKVPWNKMAGRELEQPKTESAWAEKIKKENTKRGARASKVMELIGYEYEAPEIKAVEAAEEVPEAIEAPPPQTEAVEKALGPKKAGKAKKGKKIAA